MRIIKEFNPFTAILVLMMVILGFTGISLGLTNLNTMDTKNILERVDESTTITEQIVESGRTRSVLLSELNQTQQIIEEARQNQTERLLSIFFDRSVNHTNAILNNTNGIIHLLENISEAINNLPKGDAATTITN